MPRCINGSTLLHTASYFGAIPVLKVLLKERVDVNLLDYKGATALHRARDPETIKVSSGDIGWDRLQSRW